MQQRGLSTKNVNGEVNSELWLLVNTVKKKRAPVSDFLTLQSKVKNRTIYELKTCLVNCTAESGVFLPSVISRN